MGLDTVELVMRFEEDLGIDIPDAVAETLVTPRHVIDYALSRLEGTSSADGAPWTRERIAAVVRHATFDECAVPEHKYHEDAYFVADMGID